MTDEAISDTGPILYLHEIDKLYSLNIFERKQFQMKKNIKKIYPVHKYFILSKEDFDIHENLYIISVDIFLAPLLSSKNYL